MAPSDGLMSEQFYHMLEVVGTINITLTGFKGGTGIYQALGQRRALVSSGAILTSGLVFLSTAPETG